MSSNMKFAGSVQMCVQYHRSRATDSKAAFNFQTLLHTYFRIPDIAQARNYCMCSDMSMSLYMIVYIKSDCDYGSLMVCSDVNSGDCARTGRSDIPGQG